MEPVIDLTGDDDNDEVEIVSVISGNQSTTTGQEPDIPPLIPISSVPRIRHHQQQDIVVPNSSQSQCTVTNSTLNSLHMERLSRIRSTGIMQATAQAKPSVARQIPLQRLSVLTYNVWFQPLCFQQRMQAIVDIIKEEGLPDVVMLQEVTQESYRLFSNSPTIVNNYKISQAPRMEYFTVLMCKTATLIKDRSSAPEFQMQYFSGSVMGRSLLSAEVEVCNQKFHFGTSHLESPIPGNNFSQERQRQLKQATTDLHRRDGMVVFGGDMNWDDRQDGHMELPQGWEDSWIVLRAREPGYTYDGVENSMLTNRLRKRLDRILFKMPQFEVTEAKIVGNKPIQNLTYEKKVRFRSVQLPVYPSDHYGLLVQFQRRP